jgi:hypothetical protein
MPTDRAKFNLRLPADLYAEAASLAEAEGISLNAYLTLGVRNWVAYRRRGMQVQARPAPFAVKAPSQQVVRGKVGRNDPCPCGSGRKFKVCHGRG